MLSEGRIILARRRDGLYGNSTWRTPAYGPGSARVALVIEREIRIRRAVLSQALNPRKLTYALLVRSRTWWLDVGKEVTRV